MSVSILYPRFHHRAVDELTEPFRAPITGERLERFFSERLGCRA